MCANEKLFQQESILLVIVIVYFCNRCREIPFGFMVDYVINFGNASHRMNHFIFYRL